MIFFAVWIPTPATGPPPGRNLRTSLQGNAIHTGYNQCRKPNFQGSLDESCTGIPQDTSLHLSPCLENNEGGRRIGRSLNVVCKRHATHCSDVDHAFWILLNSFDIPKEGRKFARGRMLMAFRCFQMLHLSKVNFHLWPPGPLVTTVSYSFTRKDWNLKRPVG